MPRKKPRQSRSTRLAPKAKPMMPFSVVLTSVEMAILRKEAIRQRISVGDVVRGALHTVLSRTHPDFAQQMADREVESFLDEVQKRHPGTKITPALRAQIRRWIISLLTKK